MVNPRQRVARSMSRLRMRINLSVPLRIIEVKGG